MKLLVVLTICLLILAPEFVRSETLASSGNPMAEGNPSRNHQINKKLLCPDVAPGRTQVWNIAWRTVLPDGWYSYGEELTQDEQGFVYLQAGSNNFPNSKILKVNGKDGSYDTNLIYDAPFPRSRSIPTHVKGNKMYIAAAEMTTIVNTTSMTDLAVIHHSSYFSYAYPPGSYAPLNNDFMVTAYPDENPVNILRYLNTSSTQFDSTQPSFVGVYANNVIIYKNSSGIDIPIVVMAREGYNGPISVWSPNYQFTIPGSLFYATSYVQNNQLYLQYQSYPDYVPTIAIYDPETGALLQNITKPIWNGQSGFYFGALMTFGNKTIGVAVGTSSDIVDFEKEKTIIENRSLFTSTYSIPDNSVLLFTNQDDEHKAFELISLDWDTDVINAVGSFPTDGYFGDVSVSPPLIGDDCTLYSFFDDGNLYRTGLLAFQPLPVSDVVPILECINADGLGYFSYHNLEDKRIIIPYTKDRNNLEPMELAPSIDFRAHRRGKYFPLSSRVTLPSNSSFTWQLEDYILSFNNTKLLRCPGDVRFIMYFNATNTVPSGFDEWTREAFVNITGIADSRVTIVTYSGQGSVPSDIAVELQVATSNSSQDPTPEQTVQQFVEDGEQMYYFNQRLTTDPTYSSSSIVVVDIDGVGPLPTEISGTKQSQPVTQAPTGQPNTSQPQTNNQSPTDTPKAATVSAGSLKSLSLDVIAILIIAINASLQLLY